ncbi:FkbM family methyltransferase [Bryobacter aggregatus]|uniref:FkbM family methyltransferase n=1 Tax=Bryobacter aggregatus TaxID=360054 RepID=UPI0004E1F7A0|nr:FkbM family methyltransferase [Bryobacter aggregatus]
MAWLQRPDYVRQLPTPYQFFARFCIAQDCEPVGAQLLLNTITAGWRVTELWPLSIDDRVVYLDLQDPRFLVIPSELHRWTKLFASFIGPGDSFLDIGANHGTCSVAAASLIGSSGKLIAVEPQPRLAAAVRLSLEKSGTSFEVHQLAFGDNESEADLFIPLASSGSAGLFEGASAISRHKSERVPIRRADDVLKDRVLPGRVLMKLDIEGSELRFLRGARNFVRQHQPSILLELNPRSMHAAGVRHCDLIETLIELGYEQFLPAEKLHPPGLLRNQLDRPATKQEDWIILGRDYATRTLQASLD